MLHELSLKLSKRLVSAKPVQQETIGIVANPASGKDVRRLAARASIFDNREKSAIIDRALIGAYEAGATQFAYVDDSRNIAGSAALKLAKNCTVTKLQNPQTNTSIDTTWGAEALKELGCIATLILGGDGTCRAFAKGWRHSILLPLSTGTNNVFPEFGEATIAGAALGILARGQINLDDVVIPVKIIDIHIEDEPSDIALIDAVVTKDRFVGSRALLDANNLEQILLTRAEPDGVGMTSIGGLMHPVKETDDFGLHLIIGSNTKTKVHAPIAPGMFSSVSVESSERIEFESKIEFEGPCVLAFDGERERVIKPGQKVSMHVSRTGPKKIDIEKTMTLAACRQLFIK